MCPHCQEPLLVLELEGVEVDHCPLCKGTWLDGGELALLGELAGVEPGGLSRALSEARVAARSSRRCPRCRRRLRSIRTGDGGAVELDRCPRGHGLWFDRGEMVAALRSLRGGGEEEAVTRFFAELFRSEIEGGGRGAAAGAAVRAGEREGTEGERDRTGSVHFKSILLQKPDDNGLTNGRPRVAATVAATEEGAATSYRD